MKLAELPLIELPQKGDVVAGGKYRIDRLIGQGSMGAVYVGIHTTLGTKVAIKWMLPKLATDSTAVQRFLREAQIAAKIRHPNVVQPIDVSTDPTAPYIIMELLEGQSLSKYVGSGPLPLQEIGRVFLPILDAVHCAHQHHVIHRDLKLDNIFLSDAGSAGIIPKILDFGVAKMADKGTLATITQDHSVLGTFRYMSPEQIQKPREVTRQTDVYALGVILYRLLTGTFPHRADNIFDLALRIHDTVPTPLSVYLSNLPIGFEEVVGKAISPSTEKRYPDVQSFNSAVALYFTKKQEWMASCILRSAPSAGQRNPNLTILVPENETATPDATPSSLHAVEFESFPPPVPKNNNSLLWISLSLAAMLAIGTFIWFQVSRRDASKFTGRPTGDQTEIDKEIGTESLSGSDPQTEVKSRKPAEDEWPTLSEQQEAVELVGQATEKEEPIKTRNREPIPSLKVTTPSPPPVIPSATPEPNKNKRLIYRLNSNSPIRRKLSRPKLTRTKPKVQRTIPESVPSTQQSTKVQNRSGTLSLEDF